ncbi:50S ribosomal protein L11 methyltransferase [Massilia sp. Dwa41.01b]|uniref:50S ribosomal protein L11 methyltransferase n=1 Tax=unclassified Massilia TaxID=2609279 RepID=UPI001600E723|nr:MULTISPECIES: 50S ribosomal protein L11 methyltransferase [unclassified Massilia]QNA90419.1 50S ribosomal protein L11 methyltransferase [Massilia sp. Dwa41.01b]QNA97648.1 50S ribosomal protein L11 methyltransferase [Massilia sp. Se16.2.3]
MSWTEVVIEIAREHAEALSDALMEAGALSVSVEDADEGTEQERPLFGEPGMEPKEAAWDHSRVVALTDVDADQAAIVAEAAAAIKLATVPAFSTRAVADADWVRLTQSQFEPIHIGTNIWVVPSWHEAPDPDGLILELDPGLAFGTGSHPTTRLCMEWLEAHPKPGKSVLDYGCGSGILAMVAKKMGAGDVAGVDIDPQAIESARLNAERNGCEITFYVPDELAVSSNALHASGKFDIVVANILSSPLKLMAPMLSGRVAPGGSLVLSGVLARQAEEVAAAYAPFIKLGVWAEQDGWVALHGTLGQDTVPAARSTPQG